MFRPSNFPAGVSFSEGNYNVLEFGRHIDHIGFDIGFPIIERLINQSFAPRFQNLPVPSKGLFSEKPRTQSRRVSSIELRSLPKEILLEQPIALASGRPSLSHISRSHSLSRHVPSSNYKPYIDYNLKEAIGSSHHLSFRRHPSINPYPSRSSLATLFDLSSNPELMEKISKRGQSKISIDT